MESNVRNHKQNTSDDQTLKMELDRSLRVTGCEDRIKLESTGDPKGEEDR